MDCPLERLHEISQRPEYRLASASAVGNHEREGSRMPEPETGVSPGLRACGARCSPASSLDPKSLLGFTHYGEGASISWKCRYFVSRHIRRIPASLDGRERGTQFRSDRSGGRIAVA